MSAPTSDGHLGDGGSIQDRGRGSRGENRSRFYNNVKYLLTRAEGLNSAEQAADGAREFLPQKTVSFLATPSRSSLPFS
jgi:hypothetical protein